MAQFVKCGENLVKHVGGGIYLSAKIYGKKIRRSLQTNDLRIAKLKRDQLLNSLRKAATSKITARNIGEAITAIEADVLPQANLEAATIRYYGEIFRIMRDTLPCDALCSNLSVSTAREWWGKIHRKYAAQRANNVLGMAKRMGRWLAEKGARTRRLPMNDRLRAVVARQRELAMLREMTSGNVFLLQKPNSALGNACKRLGLDHLRLHDLRHFFASWGMECGIDATTLAGWLGHKDGGRLLLARYAHLRDTHSAASAAKLL